MKRSLIFLIVNIILINFVFSQSTGVGINTTGAPADNSAILDVSAKGKGLLIPRMSTANRPASPAESLLIFNTDTRCFEAYNAATSQWFNVSCLGGCSVPDAPVAGTNVPNATQVLWNWSAVSGATGYKWSTINDYSTATETTPAGTTSYIQSGLGCGNTYTIYIWAFSLCGNSTATSLTQAVTFIAPCTSCTVKDADNNSYPIIGLGTQCWMAENLRVGIMVDGSVDQTNNSITEKYCYGNVSNNCTIYGGLYQWNEMMKYGTTGRPGICPTGWHIPTDAEWKILTDYLANNGYSYQGSGTDIAKSMATTSGWSPVVTPGTVGNDQASNNSSGFNGIPGGYRSTSSLISGAGLVTDWWTSTTYVTNPANAWSLLLSYSFATPIYDNTETKGEGQSVRCVKN